jgi:hypothetical protein
MFSLIIGPMIVFACTCYPWSALAPQFPTSRIPWYSGAR